MARARPKLVEKCPSCGGREVRCSASAVRHLIRLFLGSGKRYCQTCGYKWAAARRGRLKPLSWAELGSAAGTMAGVTLITAAAGALLFLGWTAVESRNAYSLSMMRPFLSYPDPDLGAPLSDRYRFPMPASGWPKISSRYGYRYHPIRHGVAFHRGLDLPMPWGTPVYPSRDGKVTDAGWARGYGRRIIIRHPDGETTLYGHLASIAAMRGDSVRAGRTLIGRVGSTGLSTGSHLHFEVRNRAGRSIDPAAVLAP